MTRWIYKILGGVITLVISLALLPTLQSSITDLTGTGGTYEGTTEGALIDLIPVVMVVVFVFVAVKLIPANGE
jgi:hypothetical protein